MPEKVKPPCESVFDVLIIDCRPVTSETSAPDTADPAESRTEPDTVTPSAANPEPAGATKRRRRSLEHNSFSLLTTILDDSAILVSWHLRVMRFETLKMSDGIFGEVPCRQTTQRNAVPAGAAKGIKTRRHQEAQTSKLH